MNETGTKQELLPPQTPTLPSPQSMIEIALRQNASIETLTKLMDLQERWEANEARKAYVTAMNRFKQDPPKITKNKQVAFKETKYKHATLDHVCDVIGAALSKQGLSYRWETKQMEGRIEVTCIVTHELGHSESTTLTSAPDTSGSKNSIQAIGSAVTYLQRYTLLAITGMATEEQDNDGAGVGEFAEHIEWIQNGSSPDEVIRLYKNAYKEATAAKNMVAMKAIIETKDARLKELQ